MNLKTNGQRMYQVMSGFLEYMFMLTLYVSRLSHLRLWRLWFILIIGVHVPPR